MATVFGKMQAQFKGMFVRKAAAQAPGQEQQPAEPAAAKPEAKPAKGHKRTESGGEMELTEFTKPKSILDAFADSEDLASNSTTPSTPL